MKTKKRLYTFIVYYTSASGGYGHMWSVQPSQSKALAHAKRLVKDGTKFNAERV